MQELKKTYQERTKRFRLHSEELRSKYNQLAFVRLAIFFIAIGLAIFLWTLHFAIGMLFIVLFLLGFYRFILWHQSILSDSEHHKRLAQINQWEVACLAHDFSQYHNGEAYIDPNHPFSLDLDIFGEHSFFQYTNRTTTILGRNRLAEMLSTPVEERTITERQTAITELRDQLDWRQDFHAFGLDTKDDLQHTQLLKLWLDQDPFVLHHRGLKAALWLMPIWILLGLVLFVLYLPWQAAILFLIPPILILRNTLDRVNKTHNQTTHAEKTLSFYATLIEQIEKGKFTTPLLQELQTRFLKTDRGSASSEIKRLSYIISQLNVRFNIFAIFLNLGGLWDLQWVYRLEKWKARQKNRLPQWFEAMQEFEALSSLATTYFNNPDWTFPSISEQPLVEALEIGHPLIAPNQRICNDIQIPTRGHIKLITGSNMAGKSTFLRTMGLNIALAMSGAPVCAKKLALPSLRVYTSMRTQDALHESTSSFYAELKRLKFIIEAVEKGENVFFLLDEILKGTNSRDRHSGSKALISQLIKSRGSGIIATHDLELGILENQAEGAIENLCIEVEIKDGELYFDYKLKKGVSKSFNATLLMQRMGIRV